MATDSLVAVVLTRNGSPVKLAGVSSPRAASQQAGYFNELDGATFQAVVVPVMQGASLELVPLSTNTEADAALQSELDAVEV